MRTTSNKDTISLGKQAGTEILNEIKNAKESVKIVSPYLSPAFVQELIHLHKNGRKITLITSDNITNENSYSDFKASDLVKTEKTFDENLSQKRKKGLRASILAILVSAIIFLLSFYYQISVYPSIALLFAGFIVSIFYYSMNPCKTIYSPLFRIKVFDSKSGEKPWSTELIHSKIFIIDERICFLGSANFTYSGFKTHYETVIKVGDQKAINDISREVESLYNSTELGAKPIEEWAGLGE